MAIPISIQLYTVRELLKADYYGTLKQIADAGYQYVESNPPKETSDKEFKQRLDDLDLKISSSWGLPTKENLSQLVDRASLFGYRTLTHGFWIDDFKTVDAIKTTAEKMQTAADLLKPHGIQLCLHNHWFEFDTLDGQLAEDRLLEAAPAVAMELDIYWANNFGAVDVPAYVAKHRSQIHLMHVKDGPLVQGQPHTAVGDGKLDIRACINAADSAVLKYLVVELDEYVGGHANVMDAVRASYQWLVENGLGSGRK